MLKVKRNSWIRDCMSKGNRRMHLSNYDLLKVASFLDNQKLELDPRR